MLMLLMRAGGYTYGVDASVVKEVIPQGETIKVPYGSKCLLGYINYMKDLIPLADLSMVVEGRPSNNDIHARIVIIQMAPAQAPQFGLLVDNAVEAKVLDVSTSLDTALLQETNPILGAISTLNNGHDVIQVLDMRKLSAFLHLDINSNARDVAENDLSSATSTHKTDPLPPKNIKSLIVFRLGHEWVALPTEVFFEVTDLRPIRRIPHCSGDVLKGLVNLRGQLLVCVDLAKFFDIERAPAEINPARQKLIAINYEQQKWVFLADEVQGLCSCDMGALENLPVNMEKSTLKYFRGIGRIEGKHVYVIDEGLLFYGLERRIS